MTTPERLRRRQLIEGTVLIVLGVLMLAQSWYFNSQNIAQNNCLAVQVTSLTKSFQARADLVGKDSRVKTRVIKTIAEAKSEKEVRAALDRFEVQQSKVDLLRKEHPVPPFPIGRCS